MNSVKDICEIWNNGAISPFFFNFEEVERFKHLTGAKRVVGTRWRYCDKEYQVPHYVRLLKDGRGIVHFANGGLQSVRLIVRNGDGSQRVIISVPHIDKNSRPENGYLSLPPSVTCIDGIEWGCEGNDGYTDYLFDFDWNTGKLLRFARPSRPW